MAMHEFLIYNHYSLHKLVHQHLSNNVCILIIGLHACSKFGIIASMNFQINNEYCYYKKNSESIDYRLPQSLYSFVLFEALHKELSKYVKRKNCYKHPFWMDDRLYMYIILHVYTVLLLFRFINDRIVLMNALVMSH